MQARDAIELICKEAGWSFNQQDLALDKSKIDIAFDNYTFSLYALNSDVLLMRAVLFTLPQNDDDAFEIAKKGATMTAAIWQDHKVNFTLEDKDICLELDVDVSLIDKNKLLSLCQNFLDDCDFFVEHLYSNESSDRVDAFNFWGVNP